MTSPALAPRESGRLERRKARTRASILSAASQLFLKHGYEDTSIQQIAELADTGVGTLYGYFASKDEVLREVLREQSVNAVQNYRAAVERGTPSMEKVILGLAEYRRYIKDNLKLITAAFYVSTRDGRVLEDSNDWLLRTYTQMIEEGIERGDFKKLPAEAAARWLLNVHANAVLGLGIWRGALGDPT
ncbi:MAG: TetR/AcrR family transcriptional regulator, partial [Dehalococcoidia bacterium]